jgi:hypothetical protein
VKQIFLRILLAPLFLFTYGITYSQIGGSHVYEFLDLANSARIASMGGNFLAISDDDITLTLANPSLINEKFHNQIGFSFVDFYTDINYGYAQYSRTFNKIGSFVGTLQFIDYGKFTEADETGQQLGEFNASEYAMNIGWGRPLTPRFSIGANLKFIYSYLYTYHSFGMAVDVAGSYRSTDGNFTMSLIGKDIGYQIVPYASSNRGSLPFEIQFGLSQTFKHLPFRYSILINHLEKWDLRYENPLDPSGGIDPFTGEIKQISGIEAIADNLMRHIVLGGEVMIGKNFSIRGGYNYERRQELKVKDKTSTVGFSWGFGFRVSKFHISYARSTWHLVGSPNYFTVTVNLQDFLKKEQAPSN